MPLKDQTVSSITSELVQLFLASGIPEVNHSNQGRNFESLLRQTLDAFDIEKSRTTAYHPQGEGMVERLNRLLLLMLQAYVQKQHDWECHLSLVLFAYRTTVHSSTGMSPIGLMFGRASQTNSLQPETAFEPESYQAHLKHKLGEIKGFVKTKVAILAKCQKENYDRQATERSFRAGDTVSLSIPTAGKLDSQWEGGWIVQSVRSPVTLEIVNGQKRKIVHENSIYCRIQPQRADLCSTNGTIKQWCPPQICHLILPEDPPIDVHQIDCNIRLKD